MSGTPADFAIIGSTPLAQLLAGLLAAVHGRSIIYVGKGQSAYRLPRGIDLSVGPMTRPESWDMLRQGVGESLKLIARVAGRGAVSRLDPIFFADGFRAVEALSHLRHMAQGFGVAADAAAPSILGKGRTGLILRDAARLNRPVLEPALDAWLDQHGVDRLSPSTVSVAEDGTASLQIGENRVHARQTILADHEAILAHLPPSQWPQLLHRHAGAVILTASTRRLAAPVMLDIGSGTTLLQQRDDGIAAIGPRDLPGFSSQIQALLGQDRQVEQVGQTGYATLSPRDGAAAFGRVGGSGADVIAGLGMTGAFFAPALARWYCNASTPAEAEWFGARLVTRSGEDSRIGDFAPALGSMAP